MDSKTTVERIRALNDIVRRHPTGMCTVFFTAGIEALPAADKALIWSRVVAFDDFSEDNDPHGEHDFGSFEHKGQTIFWKIDYYDLLTKYGSPDPADPAVTHRLLTVLLADEY